MENAGVTGSSLLLQADDLDGIMDAFPYWSPSWTLLPNTYECAHESWEDLF